MDPAEKVKSKDFREAELHDSGCVWILLCCTVGEGHGTNEGRPDLQVGGRKCSFIQGDNYLSVGGDCVIEDVDDIGEVTDVEESDLQETGVMRNVIHGEIDGVLYSE